ncbi:MAG: hypothetical protein JXR58_08725, partial [Bacteroidales bacterium]|nr:hypothetical protein [Bacteroidales bacterium]
MKKEICKFRALIIITLTNLLICSSIFAQSPEKISYQAVIRNSDNNLVTNQSIGMQISILQGAAEGSSVYTETITPLTNANGLVSIEIGTGTTSDDFSSIDWANGPYFIKTETDIEGGTNYTISGISQLLSVPYALHAKTAETFTGTLIETDPVFNAWDKSTGISISESQITDLGTYLESESDPVFNAWDKSTGVSITESQISDLGTYLVTEADPVFNAWDKSTGVSITESQISDLGTYLETEADPVFSAWDKSTGVSITESQISDLGTYLVTETQNLSDVIAVNNLANGQIKNLSDPTEVKDATTKSYVDTMIIKFGSTSRLLAGGFSASLLFEYGHSASELFESGTSVSELISIGVGVSELLDIGISVS